MSMHKQMIGKIGPGSVKDDVYTTSGRKEDVTLADYIARKTKEPMTFEQWYINIELDTYDKTEYECMKMAWNASRENM